ncbi:dipicolinate synthase subunit A [Symbiobacterium terraclitae]|uniref:Dipicolinate synthase subunit A n=1 Tax=Symbiobacterium terraclitae TaxID=557451 RepID=A0ABS4JQ20_9FIRM|nr:dipicolinic acid synthetase subunit A [Symbiobacterium terraclitae]MBP2017636.1 dipicolinate synthase subunit A [Symbiobacterium terraclitae]
MSVYGKQIAVIGGDRRMAEAVHFLLRAGARVRVAGLEWEDRFAGVEVCTSGAEALTGAQTVILPVQGVSPDGTVYTAEGVPPCVVDQDGLRRVARGAPVFVGLSNPYLNKLCEEAGLPLIEYRESDHFATWNSIPSAEGAIQMAMESTPFTIFGSRSLVIGFGRTGRAIALLLRGLMSEVSVAARSELDQARIWAAGHRPVEWAQLPQAVAEADIIFNTVPAPVLTRAILAGAPGHAVIIDVASAPGGTDFEAARELGLTARLAPGLPGIVAPVTAGRIIAELVVRHLRRTDAMEGER